MNYDFFFKASRSQSTTQSPAVLICCLLIRNTCIISYCFSLLAVTTAAAALQLFCYQQQGKLSCDDCARQSTSEEPIFTVSQTLPLSSWTASASWIQQVLTSILHSMFCPRGVFPASMALLETALATNISVLISCCCCFSHKETVH